MDTGLFAIVHAYNVREHLKSRIVDLGLFMKAYTTVITWQKSVRGGNLERLEGKLQSLWNCIVK